MNFNSLTAHEKAQITYRDLQERKRRKLEGIRQAGKFRINVVQESANRSPWRKGNRHGH